MPKLAGLLFNLMKSGFCYIPISISCPIVRHFTKVALILALPL